MQDIFKELDRESNPEVLRLLTKSVIRKNLEYEQIINKYESEKAKQKTVHLPIWEELNSLRRLIFGKKSERSKNTDRKRDNEKEDLLLHSQALVPSPKEEETKELATEVIYHEMSEEELLNEAKANGYEDATAEDWIELKGIYSESSEITVEERKFKKVIHRRKKYKLKVKDKNENQLIVTAKNSPKLLPGCVYSIDFSLNVVSDKYLYHLPLERQIRMMESQGLKNISVKTLYNLAASVAIHNEDIVEKIRKDIFDANLCVHIDETPWPIYGKDDDGYMWCISNQAGSLYRFEPTRSGKIAQELLNGYSGPVLSDAYQGYNRIGKLNNINLGYCWSHARRKFFDIKENYPADCEEILALMDELFRLEHLAKTFDELKRIRETESKDVIDKIRNWAFEVKSKHLAESYFTKAVSYLLKHWEGLTLLLKDVKLPLTNNDVERVLRYSVLGRKNFHGSKTINGADVAATLYTVIESCKKSELNPVEYMKYVILTNLKNETPLTHLNYAKKIREM